MRTSPMSIPQALVMKRNLLAGMCVAAALASGCASQPAATPAEEVAVWLSESPRTIGVRVSPELPTPQARVRDHQGVRRVAEGAKSGLTGAGLSVLAGCGIGGPIGCVVGAIVAPAALVVGAVAGAVKVDSIDIYHPIADAQGAPELLAVGMKASDLNAQLTGAIIAEAAKASRHDVRPAGKAGQDDMAEEAGTLAVSIDRINLFGAVGEDPSVALALGVRADLNAPTASAYRWGEFTYEGSRRPISEWKANDARLFREEIDVAIRSIATHMAQQFRATPSTSVIERVAATRAAKEEVRRKAAAVPLAPPVPQPDPVPIAKTEPTAVIPAAVTRIMGASWTYSFQENMYRREKQRFTVEVKLAERATLLESFEAEGSNSQTGWIDSEAVAFARRSLPSGESLLELAPYLAPATHAETLSLSGAPSAYPLGRSPEPWRVRVADVRQEQVSVPAGLFNALRVEVRGERSHAGLAGLSGGQWNTLAVTRFEYTAWYAPEVKRYVMARHRQWNPSGAQIADELVRLESYRAATTPSKSR